MKVVSVREALRDYSWFQMIWEEMSVFTYVVEGQAIDSKTHFMPIQER